ncbi:MAG: ATP-binding protein [Candidatus Omnitrophota bacterium]
MIKPNPFTPQSGWEPRVFGGREKEIDLFKETLQDSVSSKPAHLAVLGEWGIGKTSLLKQFRRISQENSYPACFCSISRFTKKNKPLDAVYLIAEEMAISFSRSAEDPEKLLKMFSRKSSLSQAQTQFARFLIELWKTLDVKLAVILLDDLQNLLAISNTIDILRATLSRDDVLNNTKFMFVLSSTPNGWGMFIDKHDPVGRFFRKRLVTENLTEIEVIDILDNTLKDTGVCFSDIIKKRVFEYTYGHPYEVQLLSSHLYDAQIEGSVGEGLWDNALNVTLRELGKDYFNTLISKASDRERDLLRILAEEKKALSIKDFRNMMIVGPRARKFPIANIKNFLYRLHEKGLVARLQDGSFAMPDRMFREFVLKFG